MKRMSLLIIALLTLIAVAVGTPAYAAKKEKDRNPVILMLDPLGPILREGDPNHESSLVVVDRNGNRLGIAEIPGLASENVVMSPHLNSDGTSEIISTNEGPFKNYVDSAVLDIVKYSGGPAALSADALSKTPMYIVWEADCGTAYCRKVGGEIVDCVCYSTCSGCYYINIVE